MNIQHRQDLKPFFLKTLRLTILTVALVLAAFAKARELERTLLGSRHGGRPNLPPILSKPCRLENWFWRLLEVNDPDQRRDILTATLKSCSSEFLKLEGWSSAAPPLNPKTKSVRYSQLPLMPSAEWLGLQEQSLTGRGISGWWRMLDDGKSHPALIIACDENCDPTKSKELQELTQVFGQEASFHLVVLESRRSMALKTGHWLVGSIEDAQDQVEAGLWLKVASKFRTHITSLHAYGSGRAGQTTLNAALLSDANPVASDRKVLQSVVALCPLVRSSTELFANGQPSDGHLNGWQTDLHLLAEKFPAWREWLEGSPSSESWSTESLSTESPSSGSRSRGSLSRGSLSTDSLAEAWLKATLEQARREPLSWLNPFRQRPPETREQWAEATDFVYQSVGLKTDAQVIGSADDRDLIDLSEQHRDGHKTRLRVDWLPGRTSCQTTQAFGHLYGATVLRSAVMVQNFEIWPRFQFHRIDWTDQETLPRHYSGRTPLTLIDSHWLESSGQLTLIRRKADKSCLSSADPSSCAETVQQEVDAKTLPEGLRLDADWLNAHTRWIQNDQGEVHALEWVEY